MLTVVGLGPGSQGHLTLEAKEALLGAKTLFLRTEHHPTVEALRAWGLSWSSFDSFYEEAASFEEVYEKIVLTLLAHPDAVYAVPGNPMVAEDTVRQLLEKTQIKIIPGLSALDAIYPAIGVDPSLGMQIFDGMRIERIDPRVPCLILQLYSRGLASDIKLDLMRFYPDEHPVKVILGAGTEESRIEELPLYLIDRLDWIDPRTSLFLPAAPARGMGHLIELVARLRQPDGCPWDREQTHFSLRRYALEEAYETVEAIDSGDPQWLEEELGDLLLQVVLHAQIAEENGDFELDDVAEGISRKLILRHPHVFGSTTVKSAEEVKERWEEIKKVEKGRESVLAGVPSTLPALTQSEKLQKKAATVGFDWPDLTGVFAKIEEEIGEVKEEIEKKDLHGIFHEIGDVLLALANLARKTGVDPEDALRQANKRFVGRFQKMEELAERPLSSMNLEELEEIYQEAKKILKKREQA
ncbi:MAG TPA: nucleoside triphosphate pyrophosphohydrolase [Chroococcales cyanobacterium]